MENYYNQQQTAKNEQKESQPATLSNEHPNKQFHSSKTQQPQFVKTCMECDAKIKGRVDKRFCDDNCRSAFHNKHNRNQMLITREINAVLRRNRQILKDIFETNQSDTIVSKQHLEKKGFLFDFLTHSNEKPNNPTTKYCYEFGYLELKEGQFKIYKTQDLTGF